MHDTRTRHQDREDMAPPCPTAARLRALVVGATTTIDVETMAPAQARAALEHWTAMKHAVTAMEAAVALRAATRDAIAGDGARDAADWFAKRTGTTAHQGRDALGTARKLRDLPATAARARQGALSAGQTSAVADAATANPAAEAGLLDAAECESLGELRDRCGREKAAADADPDATRRRLHAARRISWWVGADGIHHFLAAGPADAIARISAALKPFTEARFTQARTEGTRESFEAYEFASRPRRRPHPRCRHGRQAVDGVGTPLPHNAG